MFRAAALALSFAICCVAQPVVDLVRNAAAGYTYRGMPGYGIAPGSVFSVTVTGLTADELTVTDGFSFEITVGGMTMVVTPVEVVNERLLAVLPEDFPPGEGTIKVTHNGVASKAAPFLVIARGFGISTVDGRGIGAALVTDPDGTPYTFTHSANPGETMIFEGTGFGPDPDGAAVLEVYFGNVAAEVRSHGPIDGRPGWDRIEVVVPEGILGCFIGTYVKLDGIVSNTPTVSVAPAETRICDDLGFNSDLMEQLLSQEVINAGWLSLSHFITRIPAIPPYLPDPTSVMNDAANAGYIRYTPFQYSNYGGRGDASYGSCIVTAARSSDPPTPIAIKYLDAGANLTLTTAAGGELTLAKESPVPSYVYSGNPPSKPNFIPEGGGSFTFHIPGGEDVGAHDVSFTTLPLLTWTNRDAIRDIRRDQDLEITWSGGVPGSYVMINGSSSDGAIPVTLVTLLNCGAPAEAGRIVIPRDMLSSLLPSFVTAGPVSLPTGRLSLSHYKKPEKFTAPGIENGNINSSNWETILVNFK